MLQSNPSPWQVALGAIERAIPAWRQMCADWGILFDGTHHHEDHHGESGEDGTDTTGTSTDTTGTSSTTTTTTSSPAVPVHDRPNVVVKPSGTPVDDKRVLKVAKQVLAACSAAKAAIEQRTEAVRVWGLVRERVRSSAWSVMLQRTTETPVELPDRKSIREFQSFTRLRGFKYGHGGSTDTRSGATEGMPLWDRLSLESHPRVQIGEVTQVLERHFNDLKRIYRHYACAEPGAAGTLDLNELWMLVKDTKLLDTTVLTLNDVQHLFQATVTALVGEQTVQTDQMTGGVSVVPTLEFNQ